MLLRRPRAEEALPDDFGRDGAGTHEDAQQHRAGQHREGDDQRQGALRVAARQAAATCIQAAAARIRAAAAGARAWNSPCCPRPCSADCDHDATRARPRRRCGRPRRCGFPHRPVRRLRTPRTSP
ncbi:hypothetical protein ACFPRL_13970 [Pseudoclavibacter helvolus]